VLELIGLGVIIDKLRIHNLNGSAQAPRTSRHTFKLLNEPLSVCRLKILVKVSIVVKVANIDGCL
jgi:hypothetical protein